MYKIFYLRSNSVISVIYRKYYNKKCFDFIDREMLLYKLLLNKVDGKLFNSISNIYACLSACVRLNNKRTQWFDCLSGLKHGCNLSLTLSHTRIKNKT